MLNFEGVGVPICDIKPNEGKKKGTLISLASPEEMHEVRSGFDEYSLQNSRGENYHMEVAVNTNTERQIIYIAGASGSGKSFWARRYIEAYQKSYPKRDIIVFSALNEDSSIDKIKDLKRIKLTDAILQDDLPSSEFADSLVLMDDIDSIQNSKIRKKVMDIQSDILQTGRHFNVSCVITNHLATDGKATRLILAEAHIITFFAQQMPTRMLKYLLENYIGLDKEQIKKVKNLPGRSVSYIKGFPRVLVSDKEVMVLKMT
jgi:hypothetical protein